jgi:UDP-N-acetylglucosamine 2-epimerase
MPVAQTLAEVTSRVLSRVDPILAAESPDIVYVQGDTISTLAGALGAFYRRIPVAHVEAGTAILVGTHPDVIYCEASRLFDCEPARRAMTSLYNPFGRGQACRLIADATVSFFNRTSPDHVAVSAPLTAALAQRTACGEPL